MMNKVIFIIAVLLLFGCNIDDNIEVNGVVNKVHYKHIGKGNYNQIVNYNYMYKLKNYENQEVNNFKWKGNYNEGDSIKVQFNSLNPEKSKIVGKLHQPKKVKSIKLIKE